MSIYTETQNKTITINFRQVRILCLRLLISVKIFYFILIYTIILKKREEYYSLYMGSDWLAFLFLSQHCATGNDNYIAVLVALYLGL